MDPLARVVDAFALHGSPGNAAREDLIVPVAKILSEFDVRALEFPVRRPDAALVRTWEVAGTSHNERQADVPRVLLQLRDIGTNVEASLNCTFMPPGSAVPFHYVMAAAIDHLNQRVTNGIARPSVPPLEFVPGATPRALVRNERRASDPGRGQRFLFEHPPDRRPLEQAAEVAPKVRIVARRRCEAAGPPAQHEGVWVDEAELLSE